MLLVECGRHGGRCAVWGGRGFLVPMKTVTESGMRRRCGTGREPQVKVANHTPLDAPRARASSGIYFYQAQIKDTKVIFEKLHFFCSRLDQGYRVQSCMEKTIARSHSVLMHACMAGDCIQLSIEGPTDMRAGRARLATDSNSSRDFGSSKV